MTDENAFPYKNEYERMIYQRKKLEQQDELIDNMIAINKENKQLGKEMTNNLRNQNIQIDKVNNDMDIVGSILMTISQTIILVIHVLFRLQLEKIAQLL